MQSSIDQNVSSRDAEITRLQRALEAAIAESERQAGRARVARLTGVSEISAMLAHQIAQPLTAINAYAIACQRAIKADAPDLAKLAQNLEKLEQQSRRASEMIRHFTQFLRRRAYEVADIDLNTAMQEAVALLDAEMRRYDIDCKLELMSALPAVRADRMLVEQVACDLLRNAIEALKKKTSGKREIVIQSSCTVGGMVEVSIGDTGAGLDTSIAEHIFDPFADDKPAEAGIGLPISRSIVEAHGGHIRLKSNNGQGAVFAFALPATNGG